MFPKIIPEFSISYPDVRVNISDETSVITEEALLSGDIDLAFYSKPRRQNPHIEYETLAQEELRLCTRLGTL